MPQRCYLVVVVVVVAMVVIIAFTVDMTVLKLSCGGRADLGDCNVEV